MFILTILYLLFTFNLMDVLSESGLTSYKSPRFWVTVASLSVLSGVTFFGYFAS